jgi:hypothetical protein
MIRMPTRPAHKLRALRFTAVALTLLAGRAALADGAACDARSAPELRTVFTVSMGLDDALRRAAAEAATPEYLELRAKLAEYDERHALPCAAAAASLLAAAPDATLARALLDFVSSRGAAVPARLPRSLAHFADARPGDFTQTLSRLAAADRCTVVDTLETGWGVDAPGANADAPEKASAVAQLRRVYCPASGSKPARESPRNRMREKLDPDRPQSRPRWA